MKNDEREKHFFCERREETSNENWMNNTKVDLFLRSDLKNELRMGTHNSIWVKFAEE